MRMIVALALALTAVPVAAQQEAGERAAQARLPQGRAPLWATLRTTRIGMDERRGLFTASHPPAVRALVGRAVSLPGFMLPLDAATQGTHFLLSRYTPVCAFCPPGEPNEVVEVRSAQPVVFGAKLVTVTGRFALENDGEKGLFFQLNGASVR